VNVADELHRLLGLIPGGEGLVARFEHLPASLTPEPYRSLLVHEHHMTLTMEQFHGSPVRVRVLNRRLDGSIYARHILLEREDTGRVVQFGIVRFDLACVTAPVREEILSEQIPLGRTLINFNVLRHIDLGAILKIWPGPELQTLFQCAAEQPVFGRLATIFCNRSPAVDLLEIAAPLPEGLSSPPASQSRPGAEAGPVSGATAGAMSGDTSGDTSGRVRTAGPQTRSGSPSAAQDPAHRASSPPNRSEPGGR